MGKKHKHRHEMPDKNARTVRALMSFVYKHMGPITVMKPDERADFFVANLPRPLLADIKSSSVTTVLTSLIYGMHAANPAVFGLRVMRVAFFLNLHELIDAKLIAFGTPPLLSQLFRCSEEKLIEFLEGGGELTSTEMISGIQKIAFAPEILAMLGMGLKPGEQAPVMPDVSDDALNTLRDVLSVAMGELGQQETVH